MICEQNTWIIAWKTIGAGQLFTQLHSAGWLLNRLILIQERLFGFQHVRELPNQEWLFVTLKTAFETTLAETI